MSTRLVKWWTPCVALLVIVVVQAILFVAIIEVGRGLNREGVLLEETKSRCFALYSVIKNAVVFLVLLLVLRGGGAEHRGTLRLKRVSPRGMALSCVIILSLVPWDMYMAGDPGAERMIGLGDAIRLNGALVVSWMSLVFLTPVAEELFFRGFALSVFGKNSVIAGVLGSCVLFGIYHFSGSVASVVIALPFALATAYSVVVTGSVYPAIVAHALWNLLAVAEDAGVWSMEPTSGVLVGSAALCIVSAAVLPRLARVRRHESETL